MCISNVKCSMKNLIFLYFFICRQGESKRRLKNVSLTWFCSFDCLFLLSRLCFSLNASNTTADFPYTRLSQINVIYEKSAAVQRLRRRHSDVIVPPVSGLRENCQWGCCVDWGWASSVCLWNTWVLYVHTLACTAGILHVWKLMRSFVFCKHWFKRHNGWWFESRNEAIRPLIFFFSVHYFNVQHYYLDYPIKGNFASI